MPRIRSVCDNYTHFFLLEKKKKAKYSENLH